MRTLILWLEYQVPSANQLLGHHWSRKQAERTASFIALRSEFQSSRSAADFLTQTTSLLAQNNSATFLRNCLDAQTPKAQESSGNTAKPSPEDDPAPL